MNLRFREKIFGRKEMQPYLESKNLETPAQTYRGLKPAKMRDVNLKIAFPLTANVDAGSIYSHIIEVIAQY